MNVKSLSTTLTLFLLSILVFAFSSFAWFALSDQANISEFIVDVSEFEADIVFQVRKNSGTFTQIDTQTEMNAFLNNAKPGDQFDFYVTVQNLSSSTVSANIYFDDIYSTNSNAGYDLRNVFILVNGAITVNASTHTITPNSTDTASFAGQTLNLYRLSNLIDSFDDISLVTNREVPVSDYIYIEYSFLFDPNTEDPLYQEGILGISYLNVMLDSISG